MHKDLALTEALVRLARERPGVVIAWTHDLAWSDPQYANERHPGDPWGLIARAHPGIRYVAVSDERANQLAALAGLKREGVAVVPNGVDIAAALGMSSAGARLAERRDRYRADPLLVLPARLTRRKRIEAAMAATASLRGRGRPAMLVVTGPPGPHNAANVRYLAELKTLAEGIPGVHLLYALGMKAPYRVIADLYALSDALVLPSQSEGFGIPLLEAALHRLPIVCSDLETLRALAGDAATYVPPDAPGLVIAARVAWDAIREACATERPDLLVVGWRRPGWDVLGTTIEAILRQPPCDLAVVKGRPARAKRILVPVRGGRYAQLAARLGIELARSGAGAVTLLHVAERNGGRRPVTLYQLLGERAYDERVERLVTRSGDPAQVITDELDA